MTPALRTTPKPLGTPILTSILAYNPPDLKHEVTCHPGCTQALLLRLHGRVLKGSLWAQEFGAWCIEEKHAEDQAL